MQVDSSDTPYSRRVSEGQSAFHPSDESKIFPIVKRNLALGELMNIRL
jgi:hypothetical protein